MALQSNVGAGISFRHRIKEIELKPTRCKYDIELELLVDDKIILKPPPVPPKQLLRWDLCSFPCDVRSNSRVVLKVTEKHVGPDRVGSVEYSVSEVLDQTMITRDATMAGSQPRMDQLIGRFSGRSNPNNIFGVTFRFPDRNEVESVYSLALSRATALMQVDNGPLGSMVNARYIFKTMLGFGRAVAELNSSAKLVVALLTQTWELLEKEQQQHDDIRKLMSGFERITPVVNSVKEHTQSELVRDTISKLLNLIEDTSHFILSCLSKTVATRTLRSLFDGSSAERLGLLLEDYNNFKEDFDRRIGAELLKHTVTREHGTLIDRLNPALSSHYSKTAPCQSGTRERLLDDIHQWVGRLDSKPKLLWLYGQAGLGKSTVSASVCRKLDEGRTLGAHFFCKRDDPELRSPDHILNTIIHRLTAQYKPYGRVVATAIDGNAELPNLSLEQRYTHLIERPLRSVKAENLVPPSELVVLVDALDECEHSSGRQLLLTSLLRMSQLVPWLKLIVTSRPDPDIKAAFGGTKDAIVFSIDARNYDASHDILAYTQQRMSYIAQKKGRDEWPTDRIQLLSERADGLFIWAETACRFIENGANTATRLDQILANTQSVKGTLPLDMLYTTAINHCMGDEEEDNVQSIQQCLGAILATGSRTPLSVVGLEKLLAGHLDAGVVRNLVQGLSSVLYQDQAKGKAVRVYHKSFADYLVDASRSKNFHVNSEATNGMLAERCLSSMTDELRFNICGLETSYALNNEVQDLDARIRDTISEHLWYSCLHWSSHILEAAQGTAIDGLDIFLFGSTLLYWIEALSLLRMLSIAPLSLLRLVGWISDTEDKRSKYAKDAHRFVLAFYDAISESTPHLYVSALALAPAGSEVVQRMRPLFPNTLLVTGGVDPGWSPWIRNITHDGGVNCVAFSSDGLRIVSGSNDNTVRVWDAETGAAVFDPLMGHSDWVRSVAFSPNGRLIASGSVDRTVRIWDSETGAPVCEPLLGHSGEVLSIAFSPDSQGIVSGSEDQTLRIWNAVTGAAMTDPLQGHSDLVRSVAFSPNRCRIVSGSQDKTVRIWDVETGVAASEPLVGHSGYVLSVAFSPDSLCIVSGSEDRTVRIWDAETGAAIAEPLLGHADWVQSVAFSPNGQQIVSGSNDNTVQIWDVDSWAVAFEPLVGHSHYVMSVAFAPDGRHIVSGSLDRTVRIWDVDSAAAAREPSSGHSDSVQSVGFSSDGKHIVSGSYDHTVRIWDADTGAALCGPLVGHSATVKSVAFSPDGRNIASCSNDKTVRIWDVVSGTAVSEPLIGHSDWVWSVAFSPDGQRIISGSDDGTVRIWDVKPGSAVREPLVAHSHSISSVAFSRDGRRIATGCEDNSVCIWDVDTGAPVSEPLLGHSKPVYSIAFSPDGRHIISGSDDHTVRIWDAETGAAACDPLVGHSEHVCSVAFSPNGRHIVSGSWDKSIRIWDAATGAAASEPLLGHSDKVLSVAFSPDSQHIASGSMDKTIRIWHTAPAQPASDTLSAIHSRASSGAAQSLHGTHQPGQTLCVSHLSGQLRSGTGWVCVGNDILFWVPPDQRQADYSAVRISRDIQSSPLTLDLSRFVCGKFWTQVAQA